MILDLFAGPGGWSEGLRRIGLTDVGIEWDAAACATRAAAGHRTIRADVEHLPLDLRRTPVVGLIASPPCQDFSLAGKGAGRTGDRGRLIDLVPEWVAELRPEWVACEQVPPCLPIWQEHADQYRALGYSVWCGVLNAADYGVPQTRKRAYLMASRVGVATPPAPTHAKDPAPSLFGDQLEPWVSLAAALGWGEGGTVRTGANTMKHSRRTEDIVPYERSIDLPAPTLDAKVGGAWVLTGRQANGATRAADQPAMTITGSADNGNFRWYDRRQDYANGGVRPIPQTEPAPTLTGTATAKGVHRWIEDAATSVKITVVEALVLQGFPADYPVQGSRSKQFEQVGNAVCPPMAAAVVGQLTGASIESEAA